MSQQAMATDSAPGPTRRGHPVAALVAIVLSVVLHGVMLSELPPLPLGRVLDSTPWEDYPTIQLGQILRTRREQAPPPARFRPENPQEIARVLGEPDLGAAVAETALPVPEAPDVSTGPLKGESQALVDPAAPPERATWDPRQEIIEIDRELFDEKISALPRRVTEAAERTDRVPDVVLPVEQPADLVTALQGGGPPGIESASRPTVRPRGGDAAAYGVGDGAEAPDLLASMGAEADLPEERVTELEAVETYLELDVKTFRASDEGGAVYFQVEIRRHGEASLPVLPRDVLLMQDCSESMTPSKLIQCKRGLRRWLDTLGPEDRFDILGFSDSIVRCFNAWTPLTPASRARALAFIDGLRASGNTDVYASLQAALGMAQEPDRPVLAVLVTDGRPTAGVTGSSDIIARFTDENTAGVSMFALGGGRKVNRFLLDLLSYRNRGDALVVQDEDDIPEAMERWSSGIRRPVLFDLRYRFTGMDEGDVYPQVLTHLYLDRPLVLFGRVPGAPERAAFQVVGRSGGVERDLVFPLDLAAAGEGTAEIRRLWAWQRVYDWIGEYTRTQDPALLDRLRSFADRYGLVVPYGYGHAVPRE